MSRAARWPRRVLLFGLGLFIAVACTPEYNFVDDPKAEHCSNGITDVDETDRDCGGACKACGLGQGCEENGDCAEGQCIEGFCQAAGCDNGAHDEGETGVDCGGMCKPCQAGDPCEGPADCASKVCTDAVCVAPTCDDGIINGTETGRDCGGGLCDGCGTGSPCNQAVDCRSGVCAGEEGTKKCEVSCLEGTAECDGVTDAPEDECETNILTDAMHCGDCETTCELAHAEPSCVSGRCQIDSCNTPYGDCDNEPENGCEVNRRTSALHCGACGNECSDQNGTPTCVSSECQIECDEGFDDCNEDRADGCEQSTGTDVLNCGVCENECPFDTGETPFCVDGECGATVCPDGRGNCDGRGNDCEKDLTNDILNCGRCGGQCTVFKGTPLCDENGCGVQGCEDGWANCNSTDPDRGYMNGCETNTDVDSMNCGRCGMACPSDRTCSNGTCVCTGGLTQCSGTCVNTINSNAHCGMCGNACTGGRSCVNSVCQCPSGQTFCGGVCVDAQTDEMNCGTCGRVCDTPAGTTSNTCTGGACVPACGTLRASCDMEPWDGCEENLASNNAHCGTCGRTCQFGASAHVNPATQAGNSCSASGACEPSCAQGFMDCDGEPWDGCEADVTTATRCGSCSNDCAGSACGSSGDASCCIASGTQYRCQAQITMVNDVDASVNGGTLSFIHALQPGTNRLILLAIASEVGGGGATASRPDIVTYGGTAMTAGTAQSGGIGFWSPDLFFYYLTESGIGTKTGNQMVVIDGAPSSPNPGSPSVIIANLVELAGVKQSGPLGPYAGGTLPGDNPNPDVISHSLAVATSGSRIYTLTAGMFCGASSLDPTVSPAGPTLTTLLNNTGVAGSVDMRAAGAYVGSGSAAILAGGPSVTYAVGWTYGFCGEVTHEAVVVSPAP